MSQKDKEQKRPEDVTETKMGMDYRRHDMMMDEKDDDEMETAPAYGATSFAQIMEAERANEAARNVRKRAGQVPSIVEAILTDPTIEDKEAALADLGPEFGAIISSEMTKERWQPLTDFVVNKAADLTKADTPMKTEGGVKYPADDFAFVPDPQSPSSWKLRLTATPGKVTRDQLGAAAAAFSPGGFRGNKVQLPAADMAKVKAKIRAAYRKLGVKDEDMPPSIRKELQYPFLVYKQKDGSFRWLAIYSNKFRDRDNPPEIISEASHLAYTKGVNSGELPYPELWLWHVDGSRWGQADFVGYDDNGFAVASGTVDKGKEWVAESLMNYRGDLLTSHGMPRSTIERDPEDKTIITRHVTKEISPLPANVAANEYTGFTILGSSEVKEMALSQQDKAKLTELGVDADRLEAETESKAKETEGLEYKGAEKPEAAKETAEGDFVSRDEVADLVKSVAASTNKLVEVVGNLADRIERLEANKLQIDKETLERTPAASLTDLYKSVIGSDEARIDGRSSLAKSGPTETPDDRGTPLKGGIAALISRRNIEIERGGVQ
jgi:hypothetical protein